MKITVIDCETNQQIVRDMTAEELAMWEADRLRDPSAGANSE